MLLHNRGDRLANTKGLGWLWRIVLWTFFLSVSFNFVSQVLLEGLGLLGSLLVLVGIVLIGVVFDVIGVAAAVARLAPLNARAAKKLPGARQALNLAKNSERVATFCNDVVGDIAGIVSGGAAAAILFSLAGDNSPGGGRYLNIALTALVAVATVGGKGYGKYLAINYATEILGFVGKALYYLQAPWPGRKRK